MLVLQALVLVFWFYIHFCEAVLVLVLLALVLVFWFHTLLWYAPRTVKSRVPAYNSGAAHAG